MPTARSIKKTFPAERKISGGWKETRYTQTREDTDRETNLAAVRVGHAEGGKDSGLQKDRRLHDLLQTPAPSERLANPSIIRQTLGLVCMSFCLFTSASASACLCLSLSSVCFCLSLSVRMSLCLSMSYYVFLSLFASVGLYVFLSVSFRILSPCLCLSLSLVYDLQKSQRRRA